MDATPMELGAKIAALRKEKGLTQEQLAAKLGISAPAVSKWETGSSCPDIALLCPLARALGTNLDTLLQFEQTLPDKEVVERINALIQSALHQGTPEGWQQAEQELEQLLRRYPGCTVLQFNAAATYDAFQMFVPAAGPEQRSRWQQRKQALLEEIRTTGGGAYWQSATIQLASLAVSQGELEKGAALLKELPEQAGDPSFVWAQYYLKKEQPEEALKLTQKQLYKLLNQMQTCLITLMNPQLMPRPEQLLQVSRACRTLAQTFGLMDLTDGPMMEAYLRMGEVQKAAECFVRYVDHLTGPMVLPKEELFAPGVVCQKPETVEGTSAELRRMVLKEMEGDEKYRVLESIPDFAAALEKLRASV